MYAAESEVCAGDMRVSFFSASVLPALMSFQCSFGQDTNISHPRPLLFVFCFWLGTKGQARVARWIISTGDDTSPWHGRGYSVRAGELTFRAAAVVEMDRVCVVLVLPPLGTRLTLSEVLFWCSLRLLPSISLFCRRVSIRLVTSGSTITIPLLEVSAYSSGSSSQRIPTYAIA